MKYTWLTWLLLGILPLACAGTAPSARTPAESTAEQPVEQDSHLLPLYADDTRWGASAPRVTVVAFLDFSETTSRERYLQLLDLLRDDDAQQLRLVLKHAPMQPEGRRIAEASLAVERALGPDAGREFLRLVSDSEGEPTADDLASWALEVSKHETPTDYREQPAQLSIAEHLDQNRRLAERLEIADTPRLFVNGALWEPGSGWQGFRDLVGAELRASSQLALADTWRHYAERVQENWPRDTPAPTASVSSPLASAEPEPSWGKAGAPVSVVAFLDFECPFCSRVLPTLEQLKQEYGPRKLRLVFKHLPLPFHKHARPAHEAAAVVFQLGGDHAFWRYQARLFDNQKQLEPQNLEDWAVEVGIRRQAFREAAERNAGAKKVDEDLALAKRIGATGTPAFRINGVTLSGAQPFAKFQEIVDQQLAAADELRREGVARGDVSSVLTRRQLENPAERPEPTRPKADLTAWNVPVFDDDPQLGPDDALVTIVQFSELQCPFCKRVVPTLKALRDKYGSDIRIVWKDNPLPFHPRAEPAATVARSVYEQRGDQVFWEFVDRVFDSQPKLEDADLKAAVQAVGANWWRANAALQNNRYRNKFAQSRVLTEDFQARGTPHFFINGVRLSGAQPRAVFEERIDAELEKTRALLKQGVARAKIFETLMQDAQEPPGPETKSVAAPLGNAPYRGSARAKVVIQIFSDFQCPFCSRVNPTLKELEQNYGNKVKLVWRNLPLPFHKQAELAAQAAHEVFLQQGNQGFWKYHDQLFAAQRQTGGLERPNLETLAQRQGVNMRRFRAALDSEKHLARVRADKQAANDAGINGTPAFVINDYFLSGAQPLPKFERLVDRALKPK